MPSIEYKTRRIEHEFEELSDKNRGLHDVVVAASTFTGYEFGKPIVLTQIFRTQEEQDSLYKHIPESQRKKSPHQFWQAVDLRSWIYSEAEIERLLKFLNCFTTAGGQRKVAIYHEIPGNVKHFHVQFWR